MAPTLPSILAMSPISARCRSSNISNASSEPSPIVCVLIEGCIDGGDNGIMGSSRGLCCRCRVAVTLRVSFGGGKRIRSEPVGVALLRDSIDNAEPGRGLGLGLGGASLALAPSLSSSPPTSSANMAVPSNLLESSSRHALAPARGL